MPGAWGSADAGYPFKQEVIQHVIAAAVNAFAGDGVFLWLGCKYNPAGNSLALGLDAAKLLGQHKAVMHPGIHFWATHYKEILRCWSVSKDQK